MKNPKIDVAKAALRVVSVGGGAVLARSADIPALRKLTPLQLALIKLGVGTFLPMASVKSEVLQGFSDGIVAVGAADLVESLAPKFFSGADPDDPGEERRPAVFRRRVAGPEDEEFIVDAEFEEVDIDEETLSGTDVAFDKSAEEVIAGEDPAFQDEEDVIIASD